MKKSLQRDSILKIVMESSDHPTAVTIYNRVKGLIPNISLGTVYRNLNTLAKNGYIKRIGISNNQDRFDKTITSHHHVRCINCNKVMDIFDNTNFFEEIESKTDYKIVSHDLVFDGICHDCLKKKER